MKNYLLFSFLIVALFYNACSPEPQETDEELVKSVNVETQEIKPQSFERFLKLVGTVESQNDVQISAEVSGRIQNYNVQQGEQVEKGESILKIDDAQLVRERERLEAATAQARENYQRLNRLYEEEGVGSEIELLNARYTLQQNQASLEAVKENIAQTTVQAPFDAVLDEIILEEGEMASAGSPLLRLVGTGRFYISTGVPSVYSNVVAEGDTAQVWFDFEKLDTLRLPISFVGQTVSSDARTFETRIKLPEEIGVFKVNMNTNVRIRTLQEEDAIVISREFIYQDEGQNRVFTVAEKEEEQPVARVNPVQLGPTYQNDVVILQGLEPGQELITVGSAFLQDSMRINILESRNDGLTGGNENPGDNE